MFTSKNVWKFLIKIKLTKSNPKIINEVNPPCIMPIRVYCGQNLVKPPHLDHSKKPAGSGYPTGILEEVFRCCITQLSLLH